MKLKGTLPPHPLDLAYWTIETEPQFDEAYFLEDVRKWIKANARWKKKVMKFLIRGGYV